MDQIVGRAQQHETDTAQRNRNEDVLHKFSLGLSVRCELRSRQEITGSASTGASPIGIRLECEGSSFDSTLKSRLNWPVTGRGTMVRSRLLLATMPLRMRGGVLATTGRRAELFLLAFNASPEKAAQRPPAVFGC